MQTPNRALPRPLLLLIVIGVLAGLVGNVLRYRVEARNRRVELGIEWHEVAQLAAMSGKSPTDTLKEFKDRGVSGLIVQEDTFASLEQSGEITRSKTGEHGAFDVESKELQQRIQETLKSRNLVLNWEVLEKLDASTLQKRYPALTSFHCNSLPSPSIILSPVPYTYLHTAGIGLPPEAIKAAKELGLQIVARTANFPGVTPTTAQAHLKSLKEQGAQIVIFTGEEVLGYRGLETEVAQLLRDPKAPVKEGDLPSSGIAFGAVEFGKQKGDAQIASHLRGDFIRVHSIQIAEMATMTDKEVVERYVRAGQERNIRFLYVRLLTQAGADPIGENLRYLDKIVRGLKSGTKWTGGGLDTGTANRFPDPAIPRPLFALIGLGIAGGLMWMLHCIAPLSKAFEIRGTVLLTLLCGGLCYWSEQGREYAALLAGIAFPTIACLRVFPDLISETVAPDSPVQAFRKAFRALLHASMITSLGIVMVASVLATRPFMMHVKQYLGIKAQHLIPLLIVATFAFLGGAARENEDYRAFKRRIRARIQQIANEPARFGVLLVSLLVIVFLAFVVARTGNDSGAGASGIEMKFRAVLEKVLVVRPRTKEFLFGHPFFLIGLALCWRGKRSLGLPLFVFGCIGQVSLLNTFCHIHTPLTISFWRDIIGLVLGTILAWIAFQFVGRSR